MSAAGAGRRFTGRAQPGRWRRLSMCVALALAGLSLLAAPVAEAAVAGPGTMTIAPSTVVAGSTGRTFTLTYTAPRTSRTFGTVAVVVPTAGARATAFRPVPSLANVAVQRGTCASATLATSPFTAVTSPSSSGGLSGTRISVVVKCPPGHSFTLTYAGVSVPRTARAYTFYSTASGLPLRVQPVATVIAGPATALVVSAPASATAGTAFGVKVTAKDAFGNTATSYRGTVALTSTDPKATLPTAGYTFTATDKGTHTFAGVVLATSGARSVVATDVTHRTIAGSATVQVNPAATGLSLYAWGSNYGGALADGTTVDRLWPLRVGVDTRWTAVSAGNSFSAAVKSDGTLWTWGVNYYGQLGDGTTTDRHTPVQVGSDTHWASVAAGYDHTVALKTDGTLWAWGHNDRGQLGDGTTTDRSAPAQVGTDTHWASVATGFTHFAAIKTDGTLWTWGHSTYGALGDGTATDRSTPGQVGTDTHWASVAAGSEHTMAIRTDGRMWAWGHNDYGQLGDGTRTDRSMPVQVGTDTHWASVAGGHSHSVAIKTDGTMWAWGTNESGQLGDGEDFFRVAPGHVGTSTHWTRVAAGNDHNVALTSSIVLRTGAVVQGGVLSQMDPISGQATVTVLSADTGQELRSVTTAVGGQYRLVGLPAGRIKIRAAKPGFLTDYANHQASLASADVFTLVDGQTLSQSWDPSTYGPYLDLTPVPIS